MKPVNLLPTDVVVTATGGKPNYGVIGSAAAGFLAVILVAGYFAMARVDSVKSQQAAAEKSAAEATAETTAVRSQIQTLGQPIVDSDKQLAQGQEQLLMTAYTERHDFVQVARELRGVMDPGGWYESVEISAGAAADSAQVTIIGYMPTKELAASFNERIDGTRTLSELTTVGLESETLQHVRTKKFGRYWKFTLEASLVDTVAPFASGAGGGAGETGTSTGTTVSNSGGSSETLELSLSPEPPVKTSKAKATADAAKVAAAAKPVAAPKPKSSFEMAAEAAGGKAS